MIIYILGYIATFLLVFFVANRIAKEQKQHIPRWVIPIAIGISVFSWVSFVVSFVVFREIIFGYSWKEWWDKPIIKKNKYGKR